MSRFGVMVDKLVELMLDSYLDVMFPKQILKNGKEVLKTENLYDA